MDATQLRKLVIRPALMSQELWSESAETLLLGTVAQESGMGQFLHQIKGPALGIYQMEPRTHKDIWVNYLAFHSSTRQRVTSLITPSSRLHTEEIGYWSSASALMWNLNYATVMARLHYYRVSAPLPQADDIEGMAHYWKRYYNTRRGAGTREEFVKNYRRFVGES